MAQTLSLDIFNSAFNTTSLPPKSGDVVVSRNGDATYIISTVENGQVVLTPYTAPLQADLPQEQKFFIAAVDRIIGAPRPRSGKKGITPLFDVPYETINRELDMIGVMTTLMWNPVEQDTAGPHPNEFIHKYFASTVLRPSSYIAWRVIVVLVVNQILYYLMKANDDSPDCINHAVMNIATR